MYAVLIYTLRVSFVPGDYDYIMYNRYGGYRLTVFLG